MKKLVAMVAGVLLTVGCSSASVEVSGSGGAGGIGSIEITQSDTQAPALVFDTSLQFGKAQTKVVWEGSGERLQQGQPTLLDIYAVSLETGEELRNTYDGLPTPYLLVPGFLGQALYDALLNVPVGSRILSVAPASAEDDMPAVAVVVDVLPARATGEKVPARADMPTVALKATGEPVVTIPADLVEPVEPQVATLIHGDGEQIQMGSDVLMNFVAVKWENGEIFSSSWPFENAPLEATIGEGTLMRGLEDNLLDITAGSQVIFVLPRQYGAPSEGTLVVVVDVLDVWNGGV